MSVIKVENLYLKFSKELYVLFNINFEVNQGQHIAFVGQKGSGRTPLLRCVCGLEKQFDGNILINGQDVKTYDFSEHFQMGYLPVYPVFFDTKTVRYNLEYVLKIRKVDKTLISTKVNDVLDELGLNRIADNKIYQLTNFEKFLVSVARLKLRKLDLLIIDSFEERFSEKENEVITGHLSKLFNNEITVIKALDNVTPTYEQFKIINLKNGGIVQ